MKKVVYIAICCAVLCGCSRPDMEKAVRACAPMPEERACATAFVAGGKAYVFAGRDSAGVLHSDLWAYTPTTDSWQNLGETPLSPRVNAAACVSGDRVYIGLGFRGRYGVDSCYLRDWWEYTPETDSWQALADYPNEYTDCATAFAGGLLAKANMADVCQEMFDRADGKLRKIKATYMLTKHRE